MPCFHLSYCTILLLKMPGFFTGAYLLRNVEDPLVLRRSSPECTMLGQTMQCWRNKFTTCYHGDTSAEFFIFSHLDTRTLYLFAGPNRRMLQLNGEIQCCCQEEPGPSSRILHFLLVRISASVYRNLEIKEENLQV